MPNQTNNLQIKHLHIVPKSDFHYPICLPEIPNINLVRRGDSVEITLVLNLLSKKKFTLTSDSVTLNVEYHSMTNPSEFVHIETHLIDLGNPAHLVLQFEQIIQAVFELCCDIPIGKAEFILNLNNSIEQPFQLFILCNPWNRDDITYYEGDVNSYVTQDFTYVAVGIEPNPITVLWELNQFNWLFISFVVNFIGQIPQQITNDILSLCRNIAIKLWKDPECKIFTREYSLCDYNYSKRNEEEPTVWFSSLDLLKQHIASQKTPIKVRNSAIISGFYLSILRFLGIPSQIVTCFMCNHNNNGTMEKIRYFNDSGIVDGEDTSFSKPFHCWIKIILNSDHYPKQSFIINAVPLFNQKYLSHIGPTPLSNIRNAKFDEFYDTQYFYNAINSFVIQKIYKEFQLKTKPSYNKIVHLSPFGRMIAECDPLGKKIQDVTADFKINFGYNLYNVYQYKTLKYGARPKHPIIQIDIDKIMQTNKTYQFNISIRNNINRDLLLKISSSITTVNEWDDNLLNLFFSFKQLSLKPEHKECVSIEFSNRKIFNLNRLKATFIDQLYIKVVISCLTSNGDASEKIFYSNLSLWNLLIEFPEIVEENTSITVKVRSLPLPIPLIKPTVCFYSATLGLFKQFNTCFDPTNLVDETYSIIFNGVGIHKIFCGILSENNPILYGHASIQIENKMFTPLDTSNTD